MISTLSAQPIAEFLANARDASPESSAVGGVSEIEAIGRRWAQCGLSPGDLILFCLPSGIMLLEQFFGALLGGFVPALVAPGTPSIRLLELARVLRVRAIAAPRVNAAALGADKSRRLGAIEAAFFDQHAPSLTKPAEVVLLTSGTSGFASGCVFGIEQLLLNGRRHAESIGQSADDTVLVSLPLYYSFALVAQALATLACGGRIVLDGPPFQAERYARTVSKFGISISSLTPILVRSLLQSERALSETPRVLTVGGDSLAPEHVARLIEQRPAKELYLTYGLTQAGPRVSTLAAHREPASRYGSVGRPLAGTRVSLQPVIAGSDIKQLYVSSETVMRRRIGLTEGRANEDTLSEGTVATGDLFEQDAEGNLFFLGRLTDFIVRNGEKISLAAVRRAALQLPDVVNVRTNVVRSATGSEDFDLTLYLSAPRQDCARLLQNRLRRAEMPRNIHVETNGKSFTGGHK
jgi:acyl-CoA synthetase (AMP-forming)/AMP-acid ligase II